MEVTEFFQYGALGGVVVAFLLGWIWPKPAVDRLISDLERKEAQLDALVETYEARVIPVLVEANDRLGRMADAARRER